MLELLYPRRCPVCEKILPFMGEKICGSCKKTLTYVKEPKCKKCGKPIEQEEKEYCYDCSVKKHEYYQGVAVFEHNDKIKNSLYRFKYQNKREYADFYVEELLKCYRDKILSWSPDILIPIPLHREKKRRRGFNQAELIARGIGKSLGIPVNTKSLVRHKKTLPQKELSQRERQNNLKKAFKITDNRVKLQVVVLIDDIYTTGSTIDSAAFVLLEAGAKRVYYISISIGRGI